METVAADKRSPRDQRTTPAKRRVLRKHAEGQIDGFLRDVGFKDPGEMTGDRGCRHFRYGSADGFCYVLNEDGEVQFHVAAEVLPVPSDGELAVPLMRELLECNSAIQGAARFAIVDGQVFACATEDVSSIKDEDYATRINGVMVLADTFLPDLTRRYGKTTRKRAKPKTRRKAVFRS